MLERSKRKLGCFVMEDPCRGWNVYIDIVVSIEGKQIMEWFLRVFWLI